MRMLINLLAIVVTLQCTAYTHSNNPTASGVMPTVGMCAMDKVNGVTVPFGSKVHLPDGRVLTVTDRFGGNYDNRLDIFLPTEAECWQFGRRDLLCKIEVAE